MRWFLVPAIVVAMAAVAAAQPGVVPEVGAPTDVPDLPEVPQLDLPPAVDGVHSVLGLLVRGESFFGREVVVRGRVAWVYDCASHGGSQGPIGGPKTTRRQRLKILAKQPELCWRPHFIIADDLRPGSPSLWVVDVPRPLRPDERARMTKDEIAAHPVPPTVKVGAEVIVSARFDHTSPLGFANSDGLLVYGKLGK